MKHSRRDVLRSLGFAPFAMGAGGHAGAQAMQPRIVTLDVTATAILTGMGIIPTGAAPAAQYRPGRSDTHLPEMVIDVGQPAEPNLEVVASLKADLILSSWPVASDAPIRSIAPVLALPVAGIGDDWYQATADATLAVGQKLDRPNEARSAVAAADRALAAGAIRLRFRSAYLVNLDHDGLNIRIYGRRSLGDSVMRRLGLRNAFLGEDNIWGWRVTGLEAFLTEPDASILHLPQYWEGAGLAKKRLVRSPLWQALPQVKAGRVYDLLPIDIYGGFASAGRFAASLTSQLGEQAG